jgi:predicted esterase YcpF (UPF0227 family)
MKKVLYLHGLESNQGGPKVDFLANEFIVYAPKMDYNDPELNIKMFFTIQDLKPDLIIGSSMGGYVADILAQKYGIPAILFNPALHNRSFNPSIEYPIESEQADLQERKIVVLGINDKIIDPEITKMMLENNRKYTIIEQEMCHQTPLNIFIDIINRYKNEM